MHSVEQTKINIFTICYYYAIFINYFSILTPCGILRDVQFIIVIISETVNTMELLIVYNHKHMKWNTLNNIKIR